MSLSMIATVGFRKKNWKVVFRLMTHLDSTYELENPAQVTLLLHLYDTIETLGGWKGLLILFFGIGIFHAIVDYVIRSGRLKREQARRKLAERKSK